MASVKSKVPKLRFKGLSGEWNITKLCDISDKVQEKNKNNLITETFTNSAEYGIINQRDFFNKDISNEVNLCHYYVVQPNDFVYNPRISNLAPVGPIQRNKLNRTGVMSPLYYVFRTYSINNDFLDYYFSTSKWHRFMFMNGDKGARSDRFAIGDSVFRTMPILTPKQQEQTQIGNFFQKLEQVIELQQHALTQAQNYKKAMLQKMFPQKGEKVPKVRFNGFSGEWSEIELGEEVTFLNGRAYSQEELQDKGKYTVLRVGNFYTNSSWYYSDMELGDKYYADYGDLLYTWSASFGPHIWNGDKVIYHYHIWKLEISENIDKLFLLHLLGYDKAKILSGSNGSTMIHITKTAMESKKVFIPEKQEQIQIGNFFQQLDKQIAEQQNKLTHYQTLKKAMLQRLFI